MLAAAVILTLAAAPPELRQATRALDDVRYDEALKLLPPESAVKGYSRDELIEWYSTSALALLNLKKESEATQRFRRLFAFAPEWVLPDQYGPRVQTLVAKLRAEASRDVVSVKFDGGLFKTNKDALGLATALEVFWRRGEAEVEHATLELLAEQPPPWPRGAAVEAWAHVTGLSGSTLAMWGSENQPTRIAPLTVSVGGDVVAPASSGSGLRLPGILGLGGLGAGAISFVLGIVFAAGSHDAERALSGVMRDAEGRITSLTQRQAFELDAQARGGGTAAGIFFTAAGVLAAAGAGLLVFDRVTATPTPGGVSFFVPLDATFGLTRGGER